MGRTQDLLRATFNLRFQQAVRDRFPHAKLYGVRVANGAVVSFQRVRHTRALGGPASLPATATTDQWRAFEEFCLAARDVLIPELHLRNGSPVLILLEEAGFDLVP